MLTGKQRRYLRALAHDQKPVLQIGHSGLTQGVLDAIDQALVTHELIKVKVLAECPEDVDAIAPKIEKKTRSDVAQAIGRTLVVYRRRAESPRITLPTATTPGRVKTAAQAAPAPAKGPSKGGRPARLKRSFPPGEGERAPRTARPAPKARAGQASRPSARSTPRASNRDRRR